MRCLASWPVPLVSRLTTAFLKSRSLARSIRGSPNSTPQAFAWRDFGDELGDVQQRLRWNAAAVHADAAGIGFGIDERDAEAEIGGQKRGGVPAGPAAHDDALRRLSDRLMASIPGAPAGTAARTLRRSSAGSGRHRHRRSPGGRRTARAAASDRGTNCPVPCHRPAPCARARCRGSRPRAR